MEEKVPTQETSTKVKTVQAPTIIPPITTPKAATKRLPKKQPTSFIEDIDYLQANHIATIRPQHELLLEPELALHQTFLCLAKAVIDPDTGTPLEYQQLVNHPKLGTRWQRSASNEFGRLAQGVGTRIKGTDTMRFIHPSSIPPGRSATYARTVCEHRPQKSEPDRTRITVGGNLIDNPGDVTTRTADLTTTKILLNAVVSDPKSQFMTMIIRKYYLGTPLPRNTCASALP